MRDRFLSIKLFVGVQKLEIFQVKDFKFLGSYKQESADGDCTNEIKRRIAMARQNAVELTTIWKDKNVTSALKIRVM